MKKTFPCRLLKFVAVCALLVLSLQVFLSKVKLNKPSKPSPVPADQYRLISPDTYRYILNQPEACRNRSPFLVLMVPAGPVEAAARHAIRRTWGSAGSSTLTLFYLGLPAEGDSSIQTELEAESSKHADIIQMDFKDNYKNLTVKTMMMMSWLSTYCPHASYAMKVDADNFVNVFYLLKRLSSSPRQDFITGSVINDGRPRRNRNSKWFLSEDDYPEDSFPPYVAGAGYIFSSDLAAKISWASRFIRIIPLEDVYVGLCLRVLAVRPVYSRILILLRNLFEITKLEYNRCIFAKRILVNGFTPLELLYIWEDFSCSYTTC
ncbi:beta-1,3-galactosyltransferase 2 [Thalassophryne amazonica]|uniref:beta-1,3-galactosyltransferase 2 n=1 Tax=Thalassophryne amazonica TaxID=390379 RepID=UPI001471195E|nr:beta-1,3-galactosyltransferase 2 [Thalassophryne amazonica]